MGDQSPVMKKDKKGGLSNVRNRKSSLVLFLFDLRPLGPLIGCQVSGDAILCGYGGHDCRYLRSLCEFPCVVCSQTQVHRPVFNAYGSLFQVKSFVTLSITTASHAITPEWHLNSTPAKACISIASLYPSTSRTRSSLLVSLSLPSILHGRPIKGILRSSSSRMALPTM
jgi:hypothetical protein